VAWYKGNSGKVWQWCQDWYATDISGYTRDPTGPASGGAKVQRGGSWSIGAQGVRSANRGSGSPGSRDRFLGFRVAFSEARD
jgi:formylglycine-generating enzyme